MSKVLETVIIEQAMEFLAQVSIRFSNKIIQQTFTCLILLIEYQMFWFWSFDWGDFNWPSERKKEKMLSRGFANEVIYWFRWYLSSWEFHVNVNDKYSTSTDLRWGVPQGSIFGLMLFLLYINTMPQAADCDLFLYADDTCLLHQHKDLEWIK